MLVTLDRDQSRSQKSQESGSISGAADFPGVGRNSITLEPIDSSNGKVMDGC